MILNSAYLPSGAKKSWIDGEAFLSPGILKEILFYTHNFTEFPDGPNVNFRLQIWRPTPGEITPGINNDFRYRLVWQYLVENANIISSNGILWRVSIFLSFNKQIIHIASIYLDRYSRCQWITSQHNGRTCVWGSVTLRGPISLAYTSKGCTPIKVLPVPNAYTVSQQTTGV